MRSHHDEYSHQILTELDSGRRVSQRSLSSDLGIALGLTNLLLRRLVQRGLIRVVGIKPHRMRYLLTPAGIAEKARMSHVVLRKSVDRYVVARHRIRELFEGVSLRWPEQSGAKPVMFFGTGEVAEIGFVCLQETDLTLVGAIDDGARGRFFNVPVYQPAALTPELLQASGDAVLVVMSLRDVEELTAEAAIRRLPADRVVWLNR